MACVADSARANHISYLNCSEAKPYLISNSPSPMIFSRAAKERNDSFFFPNSPFSWSQLVLLLGSMMIVLVSRIPVQARRIDNRRPVSLYTLPVLLLVQLQISHLFCFPPAFFSSLSFFLSLSLSSRFFLPFSQGSFCIPPSSPRLSLTLFSSPFRPRRQALVFFCVRALRVCVHRP